MEEGCWSSWRRGYDEDDTQHRSPWACGHVMALVTHSTSTIVMGGTATSRSGLQKTAWMELWAHAANVGS